MPQNTGRGAVGIGSRFRHVRPKGRAKRGRMVIYACALLILLIKIADWIVPYENLTQAGCTLDYIYDGDTVALRCDGNVQTARLLGFDTPEAKDPGCPSEERLAADATARLREIAKSGLVSFAGGDNDRYGRMLVTMRVDGTDVGDILIDEGLAVAYRGGKRINWCAKLGAQ